MGQSRMKGARRPSGRECFPMSEGRLRDEACAPEASPIRPHHLRARACFMDEDKLVRVKTWLRHLPVFASLGHVWPLLFAGVQAFFETDLVAGIKAVHRTHRDLHLMRGKEPLGDGVK